jgi:cellulose synthase/poly-beta-1,6-N-acetylglucosamine synthase-like glycosyltransferase
VLKSRTCATVDPIMDPAPSLNDALTAASPRLTPHPTPWISVAIQGCVMALWGLLFLRAFALHGLFAWAVGMVYIGYDTALLAFVVWQTRDLARRPPERVAADDRRVRLSVIVAARNEAAVLPTTLAALFAQENPPDLILVADDGSDDGTAALMDESFGLAPPPLGQISAPSTRRPNLRWLRLPHGGKPGALNAALLLVDTELMLTVDADTLLERDAVGAMRRAFAADPRLVAATGILTPVCGPTPTGRLFQWFQTFEYLRNFLSRYAWMQADSLLLISGAFAGFRTAALRQVGGFDQACLVEDYELIHRLRRHGVNHGLGWTTAVVGASRAVTEAPGAIPSFLRQRRRWFGGFLQTQFWYRDMIGNRAYGKLGRLMLPVKSLDTMQPIYGLTAFGLLLFYLVSGHLALVGLVAGVMGAKLMVDLAFHLWSIRLYRAWTASTHSPGLASGLAAALIEPFSFQLLRHLGAALGWVTLLTGRRDWGVQQRAGLGRLPSSAPATAPGAETEALDARPRRS